MKKKLTKRLHHSRPVRVGRSHIVIAVMTVSILIAITTALIFSLVKRDVVSYVQIITPARFENEGSGRYRPLPGHQFVIVEMSIANPTNHTFWFAPVVQTYIQDDQGRKYPMSPTVLENPLRAGEMMPGETRRGQLSYSVPLNARTLHFHFVSGNNDMVTSEVRLK